MKIKIENKPARHIFSCTLQFKVNGNNFAHTQIIETRQWVTVDRAKRILRKIHGMPIELTYIQNNQLR